jgi:hypothetical protein
VAEAPPYHRAAMNMISRIRNAWQDLRSRHLESLPLVDALTELRTWLQTSARNVSRLAAEALDRTPIVATFLAADLSQLPVSQEAWTYFRTVLRAPNIERDPVRFVGFIAGHLTAFTVFVLPDQFCGGHGDFEVYWSPDASAVVLLCDVARCIHRPDGQPVTHAEYLIPATRRQIESWRGTAGLVPLTAA